MATRRCAVTLLPLLLAASTAPLAAQNLVTNPGFATGLDGWTAAGPPVTVTWVAAADADGSATSGAAKLAWTAPQETGLYPVVTQCVEVTAGQVYRFGGKAFIPSGQALQAGALFLALPYIGPHCSGPVPPSASAFTPSVTAAGAWTEVTGEIQALAGGSIGLSAYLAPPTGGTFTAFYDDLFLEKLANPCKPDSQTLCLDGDRFQVTATYDAGNGLAGRAQVLTVGDSGLLWFFSSSNIEAVVKVIDGCALSEHFWFFAGGLTNVEVTLTVTDTQTGTVKTYTNPQGTAFAPIQDTAAFACP